MELVAQFKILVVEDDVDSRAFAEWFHNTWSKSNPSLAGYFEVKFETDAAQERNLEICSYDNDFTTEALLEVYRAEHCTCNIETNHETNLKLV